MFSRLQKTKRADPIQTTLTRSLGDFSEFANTIKQNNMTKFLGAGSQPQTPIGLNPPKMGPGGTLFPPNARPEIKPKSTQRKNGETSRPGTENLFEKFGQTLGKPSTTIVPSSSESKKRVQVLEQQQQRP